MSARTGSAPAAGADRLSPEREQEIRERAAAATTGPWSLYYENPQSDYTRLIDIAADLRDTGHGYRCRRYIGQLESGQIDNDPAHAYWDGDRDNAQSADDAEFIAHAREDVPALLAEVDRLRTELAGRPTEAHVLRQAAAALEEDDHLAAAAELLEMTNQREHTALRPWKTDAAEAGVDTPVGGESTRTVDVPDEDEEEFPSGGSLIRHPSHAPTRRYLAANPLPTQKGTA